MTDVQVELTTSEANRLRKWGSLWLDLLHADMVLHYRQNLPDIAANAFARRALWESAVITYGRMEFSDQKRKLAHDELLRASGGRKAVAFHDQLTRWRHDHVAHRLSKQFEATAVVASYADTGRQILKSLALSSSAVRRRRSFWCCGDEGLTWVRERRRTLAACRAPQLPSYRRHHRRNP
jgi:hypothetical protein